ncbi:MAG: caspase family protein [Campylobacterota bacterium]|nr:caspase family protein [Campylobacterota bacterium]
MLFRLLLLTIIPLLLFATTDRALQRMKIEQRVALVIGNNNYDSKKLSNLKNPINDARAMKSKLKKLGFKVVYGENLTVRQMDKKLDKFSQKLRHGGVGLFFFAGHGIEYKRENYLMAKNSKVDGKNDVKYESLPLSKILDNMEDAGNRLNIVLLDACRNDPFSRSGGGGLAKSTARGTYIVYATSPGDVASDGSGKHGAFTQQILHHIDVPGVPIEKVFKRVKVGVINSTRQSQRPWISNDITGDFYFKLPSKASNKFKVPKTKEPKTTQKSSFCFQDEALTKFSLTISTTPSDAKVSITNIKPRYRDGIKLKSGKYNIKVSKPGYKIKKGEINLQTDMDIVVNLQKIVKNTSFAQITKSKVPDGFVHIKSDGFTQRG